MGRLGSAFAVVGARADAPTDVTSDAADCRRTSLLVDWDESPEAVGRWSMSASRHASSRDDAATASGCRCLRVPRRDCDRRFKQFVRGEQISCDENATARPDRRAVASSVVQLPVPFRLMFMLDW